MNEQLVEAIKHWHTIAPLLRAPRNHKGFDQMVQQLDQLLTIIGADEKHPLMGLVDLISQRITEYEETHFSKKMTKGINALKYLINVHRLKQTDLSHLVSQGVLSEILNGKRELNLRQIKLLAKYFDVEPSTFIDD